MGEFFPKGKKTKKQKNQQITGHKPVQIKLYEFRAAHANIGKSFIGNV